MNQCNACEQGGGRIELDFTVGFGIQGEIDQFSDCLAWADGYTSISSPPDVQAVAQGRLDLSNKGWYAFSQEGSLVGDMHQASDVVAEVGIPIPHLSEICEVTS